jgi:hypothetical protein
MLKMRDIAFLLLLACTVACGNIFSDIASMFRVNVTLPDPKKIESEIKSSPMVVSFVNGIAYTEHDLKSISKKLENIFKSRIRSFYNPTSGSWATDLRKVTMAVIQKPEDSEVAMKLAEHLRKLIREVGPNGRVLHIAHSGGAIMTYLAAKHHLTAAEKNRIDILTFGGGHSITRKYFDGDGRLVNYYARNDPLVFVDRRAIYLNRVAPNRTIAEVLDKKHNTSFVFLDGIIGKSLEDHKIDGPTYTMVLEHEAKLFHERLDRLLAAEARNQSMIRKIRKTSAKWTGQSHFFDRVVTQVEVSTKAIRKTSARVTGMHGFFSGKEKVVSELHTYDQSRQLDRTRDFDSPVPPVGETDNDLEAEGLNKLAKRSSIALDIEFDEEYVLSMKNYGRWMMRRFSNWLKPRKSIKDKVDRFSYASIDGFSVSYNETNVIAVPKSDNVAAVEDEADDTLTDHASTASLTNEISMDDISVDRSNWNTSAHVEIDASDNDLVSENESVSEGNVDATSKDSVRDDREKGGDRLTDSNLSVRVYTNNILEDMQLAWTSLVQRIIHWYTLWQTGSDSDSDHDSDAMSDNDSDGDSSSNRGSDNTSNTDSEYVDNRSHAGNSAEPVEEGQTEFLDKETAVKESSSHKIDPCESDSTPKVIVDQREARNSNINDSHTEINDSHTESVLSSTYGADVSTDAGSNMPVQEGTYTANGKLGEAQEHHSDNNEGGQKHMR